ncbi:STELLO glycosyltransferase family protein [Pontibacter sp. H259]|uniref:STELLO glycosyltransferase family protein n=1 Tax=Pontibacter sp. H259 TaxID=3133421 RepID=UPI0030C37ACD
MNSIIITSIFHPTKAVKAFSDLPDFQLVVIGDKKSPQDWHQDKVQYLSIEEQEALKYEVISLLPYNHYCRKIIGYLYAIQKGAAIIIDTDDDNIPKSKWGFPLFEDHFNITNQDVGFINVYKYFTDKHIWPRGFPLNKIQDQNSIIEESSLISEKVKVGIWQGLADSDPDVDAIYRLTSNEECYFDTKEPVVLAKGSICPFNSQNTAFVKELFPLLYLPSFVTFRFTDILRGLIAQPIMWLYDYHLGFSNATVIQERNPHDFLKDFESEIPCYLFPERIVDLVSANIDKRNSLEGNLFNSYKALVANKLVPDKELDLLKLWLKDLASI